MRFYDKKYQRNWKSKNDLSLFLKANDSTAREAFLSRWGPVITLLRGARFKKVNFTFMFFEIPIIVHQWHTKYKDRQVDPNGVRSYLPSVFFFWAWERVDSPWKIWQNSVKVPVKNDFCPWKFSWIYAREKKNCARENNQKLHPWKSNSARENIRFVKILA